MPTDDYIKRIDALFELYRYASEKDLTIMIAYREDFRERIEKIPAADVEPVRYAEWISPDGISICSNCGKAAPYDVRADMIIYWPNLNFCPNCGCRMNAEPTKGEDDGEVHRC